MGRRYIEIMLHGWEETCRSFEVDGRKPVGAVVHEYLKSVAPQNANRNYQIMAETPNGQLRVDENTTVDNLITR